MLRWKRKLSWWKNKAISCSLFFAVNSDIWNRLFSSTSSLIFEVMPVGCSTCRLTFKAFIISEGWWWPSDRRADSSISYRIRRGQSTLLTSLGNELSFQRQPRFQQVELQNLVTGWNGLSRAAFTSRILSHHWKWKVLVLFPTCFLPAFSDTVRRVQRYRLREREQFSGLPSARRAIFTLHHLWCFKKEKTPWFRSVRMNEVVFNNMYPCEAQASQCWRVPLTSTPIWQGMRNFTKTIKAVPMRNEEYNCDIGSVSNKKKNRLVSCYIYSPYSIS